MLIPLPQGEEQNLLLVTEPLVTYDKFKYGEIRNQVQRRHRYL